MRGFSIGRVSWVPLGLAVAWCVTACGSGQRDAMKARVAELEDRITTLQNQDDALEARLSVLESRQPSRRQGGTPAPNGSNAAASTPEGRPLLQVVKLVPPSDSRPERSDGTAKTADQTDPTGPNLGSASDTDAPRPVIRGTGNRIETHEPGAQRGSGSGHPVAGSGKLPLAPALRPPQGTGS
jgi:hypothetical protein